MDFPAFCSVLLQLFKSFFQQLISLDRDSAFSQAECLFLQLLLKVHSLQRVASAELLSSHRADDRAVGAAAVPGVLAHAVYGDPSGFGRGVYNVTARAHAEGVYASAGRRPCRQLVICRGQAQLFHLFPLPDAVLGLVYKALGMRYAKPHCKSFLLHRDSPVKQRLHGISRAVPRSKDDCVCLYFAPVSHNESADRPS